MKKFYLMLALALMTGIAVAQPQFKHQTKKPVAHQNAPSKEEVRLKMAQIRDTQAPLYKPLEQEEWFYDVDEEEWLFSCNYYLTYDKQGNMLTLKYVDEYSQALTEYEYNENSLVTSQIDSDSEDGEEWTPSTKLTKAYDSIVKDLIVESNQYTWDGENWSLVDYGRSYTRQITRDEKNRVTGILYKTFYMGEFKDFSRTTVTYNSDGLADTWKYEEINENEEMEEWYVLKEMEWYVTDGQIVAGDLGSFFAGNNRLKKAIVTENDIPVGTIEASYQENGDYSFTFYYYYDESGIIADYDKCTFTYTDEYGSYTALEEYYYHVDEDGEPLEEDELYGSYMETVTYDSHGEIIKEGAFYDGEWIGGTQYDITYDENGCMTEWLYSDWDYDLEEYVPFIKLISKKFVDVTTPVDRVIADEAAGEQVIYNIHGMKMNAPIESLPAGVYILKQGGKTTKILKH